MTSRLIDTLLLGRWRRKRALHRRMRELDLVDSGRSPRPRKGSLSRFVSVLVAVTLVATGALVLLGRTPWFDVSLSGLTRSVPLGRPQSGGDQGSYAFQSHQPGSPRTPVTYSPCRPIHVVVNVEEQPGLAAGLVEEALDEVSSITGLQFVVDGPTLEEPTPTGLRRAGQPTLIAWTSPSRIPELAGNVAGLGGSTFTTDEVTGLRYYRAGQVALDAPQLARALTEGSGRAQTRAIILHEIGHLVGLAHVDDRSQLMYRKNVGVRDFQAGDRAGLALLGSGPCVG